MSEQFSRTELLLGSEAMNRLADARVAVFGVGGVGGYVVEALARSGVGALDLIDNDTVCLSNLNRQIIATRSTLGMYKVDAAKTRIADINPDCVVNTYRTFFTPETSNEFDFTKYDYVVDAIDTVTGKIQLVMQAQEAGTPIICSMGAGNKLDPSGFMVADIYKTSVCPLAKVMRHELKKRGVKKLKVVYSKEIARTPVTTTVEPCNNTTDTPVNNSSRRSTPGSNAFVPSAAGLLIASEVVADLTGVRAVY
ncbi:MAG: tRNA threonylcarbamoyladenosine dehydratase [Lachnospiraceae bacterium]|nr:tRNA threonylcarbamoyladenosine dehydratase [Lachnospiraceae bacterium]